MKYFFTLILLTFFINYLTFAQVEVQISVAKINKNIESDFYVERVIDARTDTSAIVGGIPDEFSKTVQSIEFVKNVSSSLQDFFDYAVIKNSKAKPIIMRINRLVCGQRKIKKNEKGPWVNIEVDVFIHKDDGYILVDSEKRLFEGSSPSGSATIDFSKLTTYALKTIMLEIMEYKISLRPVSNTVISEVDLLQEAKAPTILTDKKLNDGLYANYQEFLENRPSSNSIIEVKPFQTYYELYEVFPDREKKRISPARYKIWGLCYQGSVYYAVKDKNAISSYNYINLTTLGTNFEATGTYENENRGKYRDYKFINAGIRAWNANVYFNNYYGAFSAWGSALGFMSIGVGIIELIKALDNKSYRFMLDSKSGKLEKVLFTDLSAN
jgi:hypothetical protein